MSRCVYTAYSEQAGCWRCTYTCELWRPVRVCVQLCGAHERCGGLARHVGHTAGEPTWADPHQAVELCKVRLLLLALSERHVSTLTVCRDVMVQRYGCYHTSSYAGAGVCSDCKHQVTCCYRAEGGWHQSMLLLQLPVVVADDPPPQ